MLERGSGSVVHVARCAVPVQDARGRVRPERNPLQCGFAGPTRTRLWDEPGGFAEQLANQFQLPVQEPSSTSSMRSDVFLSVGSVGPRTLRAGSPTCSRRWAVQVTGSEWAVDGGALRQL